MNPDSAIFPKFFIKPVENHAESAKEGRPIFQDAEYVEIRIAGDKGTVICKKVTSEHKQRWPRQYEQFRAGIEQKMEGTPLSEWSKLSASKAAELKALNIHTVEALAEITDGNIHRLGMGGRDLVRQARKWLEVAKDEGKINQVIAENEKLHDEVEFLKQQIRELGAKHEAAA
jgi:hypothetical protein